MDDESIGRLGKLFLERRDVKAVQQKNGAYHPDRTKWTMQDLRDHVSGKRTLGHYLVSQEDKCRLFAFDIDLVKEPVTWPNEQGELEEFEPRKAWLDESHWARPLLTVQLNAMAEGLARRIHRLLDIPVGAAYSGAKGVHVYGWTGSEPAADVRAAANEVLDSYGCFKPTRGDNFYRHAEGEYPSLEIEVFPKQDTVKDKDLGNLMRLPLGINQKTGQQGFFLQFAPPPDWLTLMDAEQALNGVLPWQS